MPLLSTRKSQLLTAFPRITMSENKVIAEVVLPIPVNQKFHYLVTEELRPEVEVGKRLLVPFGRRNREGYCIGFAAKPQVQQLKTVAAVLDEKPLFTSEMLSLGHWMSDYYFSSWGEALLAMLPEGVRKKRKREPSMVTVRSPEKEAAELAVHRRLIGGPELTEEQEEALARILSALGRHTTLVLHGITSSGKTEVYIRAIQEVVRGGKQAIVLVPEISLTPQTLARFSRRFQRVALLHSALSPAERARQWQQIKDGRVDVVIGARSAIFAPVDKLGLVVIDDEHETSFKQETSPRYHAREVAIKRGEMNQAPVVLGSATPTLETYHRSKIGSYERLVLKRRIGGHPLPPVLLVDMKEECAARPGCVISRTLEKAMGESLARGEQVILFINRRGYSFYVRCRRCGHVEKCKRCDVALVFHKKKNILLCHYCGARRNAEALCPECVTGKLDYRGTGTERIRETIASLLPDAAIAQMDSDSTKRRGSHEKIFEAFQKREIQVLVGTQMLAKGLDFPNVTTVGVVLADVTLNLPDFRSDERTFQLLEQVAGRTGRGPKGGSVFVQSYEPDRLSIRLAANHDYEGFAQTELDRRKELGYPPFGQIVEVLFEGKDPARVGDEAQEFARILSPLAEEAKVSLLGPAACPIARISGKSRHHLICKGPPVVSGVEPSDGSIHRVLRAVLENSRPSRSVRMVIDVDPVSLL